MFRNIVYIGICIAVSQILFVCGLRYVTGFWLLSLVFSLQTHITLACALAALVAFAIKRHFYAIVLFVVALAFCAHSIVMGWQFGKQATPEQMAGAQTYKLMSFNILFDNTEESSRIADAIINSGADVAYVFESEPLYPELSRLAKTYPYRLGCDAPDQACDLMILSRHPFAAQTTQSLSAIWHNRFAMVDVELGGQTVHFAAVQLTKPYYEDFHREELGKLYRILGQTPGPVILAGDFNSSIIAPDMRRFLRATGLHTANREPSTWPIEAGNYGISIDHVLARDPLLLTSVTRIPDNYGSNHYGLQAEFMITR